MTMVRMNAWACSFEPATGRIFDDQGCEQPYMFQLATIIDQTTKIAAECGQ